MKRIFICSPFRAIGRHSIEDNTKLAMDLCKVVMLAGHAPYAPHLIYPRFMDDSIEKERNAAIKAGVAWLGMADEIWIYSKDTTGCSLGMLHEIERARRFSISPLPVYMPACFEAVEWRETAVRDVGHPIIEEREVAANATIS